MHPYVLFLEISRQAYVLQVVLNPAFTLVAGNNADLPGAVADQYLPVTSLEWLAAPAALMDARFISAGIPYRIIYC